MDATSPCRRPTNTSLSRDTGLKQPADLPDIFTTYRKSQEPLRDRPRPSLPTPSKLPPPPNWIPPQQSPFVIPDSYQDLETKLLKPVENILGNPFPFPRNATSAHPFKGGETKAWERVRHLIQSGGMTDYKDTRNGLVGADFSTKLSGYLALGSITARQVHEELVKLEDGKEPEYKEAKGYDKGENEGTKAVRFELLWRDYMRLCSMKFGPKLFRLAGFRQAKDHDNKTWKTIDKDKASADQDPSPEDAKLILNRFLEGRTGMGLIDASQRELYHTGYTSNRARQNVASFLSKHLYFDWRYGAEWYEMLLVDYDVSSNWSNWQYVAGVGNDPRGDARIFNPVKQAFDYDKSGTYVRTWIPELKDLEKLENVFQAWTTSQEDLEKHGLVDNQMVTDPIKKIDFTVDRKPRGPRGPHRWRRGGGRGGRRASWNESGGGSPPGSAGVGNGNGNGNGNGGGGGGGGGGRGNGASGVHGYNNDSNRKEGETHQRHHSQQQRYDNSHVPRSMSNQYGGYTDGQNGYSNGYPNGYPTGGSPNGYTNGYSDGYSNGYSNGYTNNYPGPGTRGGWNGQGRGNGWRGSGRGGGRGNGFRRGYNTYSQHVPAPQGYAPHPSFPQPHMGPN